MENPVLTRRKKPINKRTKRNVVFNEEARRDFLTGFEKRKKQRQKFAQDEFNEKLKAEKKRIKLESRNLHKKLVRTYKPIPVLEEQLAKKFEVDDATVSVVELDSDLLAETNFLIGNNRVKEEVPKKKKKKDESDDEELPGMGLKSKKEVDREVKIKALQEVQKSRIIRTQEKMEQLKQKKISMRRKHNMQKMKKKLQKRKPGQKKPAQKKHKKK